MSNDSNLTPGWQQWDKEFVWHPYTQMLLSPEAIPVSSGEGSFLYLQDGRKVFDSNSSWWVTLHGHSHPKIAKAIAQQASLLEQVIFANFTHAPASELAMRLAAITPEGLQKVFYSDNGSTAVEVALKMCIQYWMHQNETRTTFLALEHSYHGDTFGAMSVSARSIFTKPFDALLGNVIHLPFPYPPEDSVGEDADGEYSVSEIQFLSRLELECAGNRSIAAFIFEPLLLAAGGMKMWRAQVLREACEIVANHGILTIADEVLTGFGRTGTMFACERANIAPDLMVLSKGLTGGFLPMGVTMTTKAIFDVFLSNDRSKTFFHGHSYTANPISCSAALASLDIFSEEPVFSRIEDIHKAHKVLAPLLGEHHNLHYRILGTIAAFEASSAQGYLSGAYDTITALGLDRGLFLRPLGGTLYFLPPYSTTRGDLETAYAVLDDLLTIIKK